MAEPLAGVSPPRIVYLAAFGAAAVACFASVGRARSLDDPDTRRGLVALLVTSGGWASAHVGLLAAPGFGAKYAFYELGLVVGLASIGPWLYFCSAYTGRSLHRHRAVRRVAVAVFLGVVFLKLTNPVHGVYFTAGIEETPFVHLAIQYGIVHWVVTGFVYALAAVGYFMLFELFLTAGYRTRALAGLVGLTALPVALDLVGYATPALIDITYEPLGVAAFAVGLLFVFTGRFRALQFAGSVDNPAIYLDDDGRVRDYNTEARRLFPAIEDAEGSPLEATLPEVADRVDAEEPVLEHDRNGETRYYTVSTNRLGVGQSPVGELLVISDVTETETHRRELQRQNERLERFASVVSHDLRNPLNVAQGRLELAAEEHDDPNIDAAADALDRMEALIADVLALARQGESIGETEPVTLSGLVEGCRESVELGRAELVVDSEFAFVADGDRVRQLLENLVRNAIEHGGEEVTVRVGAREDGDGFYVADDGVGIPTEKRGDVFESGYSTDDDGTGFGLAIVAEIVAAHDWEIDVSESAWGGARFDVTGVERAEP